MSTTIDQKVVEMRFDNSRFERNVSTTIDSLDKLKSSLNLSGASKGLQEVEATANRFNMSSMSSAVDTVKMRFSALEVMAVTALANITNSAVNAGKRIVSALTIQPITTGFSEYELKMGSVQTMMAATGEDLETVNGYLNELNEYSDKTIYSFSDMTQNIGKFTNAGVSLKDSVAAIQGISNVAAVSGANANEASRAMYNFAQALSSGYVKLIDWKSIELANMGTVEFKQQLIDAAVAAGTLKKSGDGMYKTLEGKTISATKNFNDSLQDQWMTSEVLINTLKNYSDETTDIGKKATQAATEVKTLSQLYDTLKESAQSGWAQTWEIIVGDFEEAKKFMTELSEIVGKWIGDSAEARNDLLENWKILGGRTALLDSIRNILEGIVTILKPIKEAFNDIFPPMTAERLVGFCEGLKNLTSRLKISDKTADKIKRTFKGLFAVIDIVRQVFVGVIDALGIAMDPLGNFGGGLLDVTATIGDLLVNFNNFLKKTGIITKAFQGIGKVVGWVLQKLGDFMSFMSDAFSDGPMNAIVDFFDKIGDRITNAFDGMGDSIKNSSFYGILTTIFEITKKATKTLIDFLGKGIEGITNAFGSGNFADFLDTLLGGGIAVAIGKLIWTIAEKISDVTGFLDGIDDVLEGVTDSLQAFQNRLNAEALQLLANSILKIVAALVILSLINKDKLADGLAALTMVVVELVAAMAVMSKIGKVRNTFALVAIANALLLMSIPLAILGSMEWSTLGKGLIGITVLLTSMIGTLALLQLINNKGAHKKISLMKNIAFALILLAIPMRVIGGMDWTSWGRGLLGITVLLTSMIGTLALLQLINNKGALQQITLINNIAFALILLSIPMRVIGGMDWASWGRGLIGITVLLTAMIGTLALLQPINTNGVLKQVTLLKNIAFALILLAIPMRVIGGMDWASWGRGLIGITVLLTAMVGTLALLQLINTNGVVRKVILLQGVSMALILLSIPMLIIGGMDWASLGRGLLGLTALLGIMVGALALLQLINTNGVLKQVTLLKNIAFALVLLSIPMLIIGGMDWASWGRGLLGITALLTVMVGALAVLQLINTNGVLKQIILLNSIAMALVLLIVPLSLIAAMDWESMARGLIGITTLLGVMVGALVILAAISTSYGAGIMLAAKAIMSLGLAMLAAGAGMALFGAGLTLVATGITALAVSIGVLLRSLAGATDALVSVIEAVMIGLLVGLAKGLSEMIPLLGDVVKKFILTVCDILVECVPVLANTLLEVITSVLESLASFAPRIVTSIFDFILAILDGLVSYIGPIVERVFDFVIAILDAISSKLEPLITAINDLFLSMIEAVFSSLSLMDTTGLIDTLKNVGILNAVVLGLAAVAATAPLAMAGVVALGIIVGELILVLSALGAIAQIPGLNWLISEGGNFLQTIGTAIGQFVGGILGGIGQGMSASLPAIAEDLSVFATNIAPFIEAVKTIDESALTGVRNLTEMILLITGASLLEGLTSWLTGESSIAKFAADLVILGAGLKGFSDAVVGVDTAGVASGVEALKLLADLTNAVPNSGGIFSWFTGNDDEQITTWANQLPTMGYALKGFSDSVVGIVPENITAGTNALKALAEMTQAIPNAGGIFSWFTGNDNGQITAWATQLPILGLGLKGFSDSVVGIVAENITAAANAAKALAEMTQVIPNTGGIAAWFTGENSVANFAGDLVTLGKGLKGFAEATTGINTESVSAAANSAKTLAEMTSYIPNEGGIAAWFTGESSVSKFAGELPKLGKGLKGFSDAVTGINAENITAAAGAAKSLAEMTAVIPKEGGIKAWFSGENSVSKFADKLPTLGDALKGFSDSVSGINPENVTAAASAAKSLAEMTDTVPKDTKKIITFGENLVKFGDKLKAYFAATSEISADAASTAKTIVSAVNEVSNINAAGVKSAADAIDRLVKSIKGTSGVKADATSGFVSSLKALGKVSAEAITKSFDSIAEKMTKVGKEAVKALAKGLSDNSSTATKAAKKLVTDCADAISEKKSSFSTAGKNLVQGFADGISVNTYLAEAKAKAMAKAAAEAAKEALDINSPSKVFREIGSSVPEGFAQGVGKIGDVIAQSEDMANSAIDGVRNSLSRIADVVNSDMDAEPTIRPVLDLTDVEYGVGKLNSMLGGSASVAMTAHVGAINSGMSRTRQNGKSNSASSAASNVTNNTYIIDGITYDDGSNVANAVGELIHAAKVERRT